MAEKKNTSAQIPNNVVSIHTGSCKAEGCKAKAVRAEFCTEHFDWFKASLINKNGERVPDFEKKYYSWSASRKKAA